MEEVFNKFALLSKDTRDKLRDSHLANEGRTFKLSLQIDDTFLHNAQKLYNKLCYEISLHEFLYLKIRIDSQFLLYSELPARLICLLPSRFLNNKVRVVFNNCIGFDLNEFCINLPTNLTLQRLTYKTPFDQDD